MVSNYLLKLKSQVKYVKLKESPEFLVTSAEILSGLESIGEISYSFHPKVLRNIKDF